MENFSDFYNYFKLFLFWAISRDNSPFRKCYTNELKLNIIKQFESGDISLNEIANLNNINKTSVHRFAHRLLGGDHNITFD